MATRIPSLRTPFVRGLAALLLFTATSLAAQTEGLEAHIRQLDRLIAQAAAEQNYAAAAGLQRDRANWVALQEAIDHHDAARILALQQALANPYVYTAGGSAQRPAEAAPAAGGPEFLHQVYTRETDGSYKPLEKQEASNASSGGGYGGFGGRVSSKKIPGDRSNVRFAATALPRFVVKTYPGQDPSDIIELVRFEVRGARKDRYVDMSKSSHAFYHHSSSEVTDNRMRIAFTHLGDQVYEIALDAPLAAGEYAFMNGQKVFAFGVNE
ncbi:MAG: hypothetical protein IPJ87_14845 [Flavobacteriales bacterium]|jgi:hypothetical protein|nr:hypothetical protein [Flavobacteriales bacterium]MBK7943127.1 hypothetical protein [Flavobacteriales bacterium]MBK8947373.1 hypothetical protein [Flavobacteriales bacterium]MBK9701820.1 hypothetical protein [Flavobacteriales bacterium]